MVYFKLNHFIMLNQIFFIQYFYLMFLYELIIFIINKI